MVHPVSPLRAVLFDVDGTLVDSERSGHRVAFNRSFEELGLPYRWDEDLYGELLLVTGGKERIDHYLRGEGVAEERRAELVPEVHKRKTRYFLDLVDQGAVPARPGAPRLIDELGAAGMRLGVVTTGSREWVETIVAQHFGLDRFEIVVTGDQVPKKKPDPSAYEIALDRLGLAASSAVAMEDSLPGFTSAKAAGLPCVVVVNDYTKDEDFEGADLVVDGFGAPDAPAKIVLDPHSINFDGSLDAKTVAAVHDAESRGRSG